MTPSPILAILPLGMPWPTLDPFLFCVYHDDAYPRGNANLGPDASLAGRDMGQDFAGKDGWRMYHGHTVPGFPSHPHRGFETVTLVRKGLIDHSDSLGATARFGGGDVQWLTAGRGIVHSEMFPLLDPVNANPLELFQIWLNLPAMSKMAAPHFTMLWSEQIQKHTHTDAAGHSTDVVCVAGQLGAPGAPASLVGLPPPPDSWAAQSANDVAIWTLKMEPNARYTLPAAQSASTQRMLYFFKGTGLRVADQPPVDTCALKLNATLPVDLVNGPNESEILILQGRPIAQPVAQYGPFVMNTQAEIHQAFADYRATEFGGWPWPDSAPVHGKTEARFARHANGDIETRASAAL
jgi:quercetin 2,3-dioxygenase